MIFHPSVVFFLIFLKVVRACPSMLNEVKKRGLALSLAAVQRADAAADARDEVRGNSFLFLSIV